jgi:hypothetical protein
MDGNLHHVAVIPARTRINRDMEMIVAGILHKVERLLESTACGS